MKYVFFDKFQGFLVGGAQHSAAMLLQSLKQKFELISCDIHRAFSAEKFKQNNNERKLPIKELNKFPYIEYILNRREIGKYFSCYGENDILISQEMWAPMAITSFKGRSIYFIRNALNANLVENTRTGIHFLLKEIYHIWQKPFIDSFLNDNKEAVKKSSIVVTNSEYMRQLVYKNFSRDSYVIYPFIDVKKISRSFSGPTGEYIVMAGSDRIKGIDILKKIARRMPGRKFLIIGRGVSSIFQEDNIYYYPWAIDPFSVFIKASLFIVPSVVKEAFCRVAVESMAMGIPCVASRIGGIPEVIEERYLVNELYNIDEWVEKISVAGKDSGKNSDVLKKRALQFDASIQMKKFKKLTKIEMGVEF